VCNSVYRFSPYMPLCASQCNIKTDFPKLGHTGHATDYVDVIGYSGSCSQWTC